MVYYNQLEKRFENMKVILMNQNTKILSAELESDNTFSKIYDYYNIDYAPLQIYNAFNDASKSNLKVLNSWFSGRGIPSWRQNIEKLLEKLNVLSSKELLDKAYGLSLSDQYWIKGINQNLEWDNINFFNNNFEYKDYLEASLNYTSSDSSPKISLHSPNNTTDGMVKKGWIIDENNKRVLVKGTYSLARLEPINEWLASQICQRLGIDYCDYTLDIIDKQLVCKCPNFLTSNEEIISASDIMEFEKKSNNINDFEHYISILEKHGITDARKKMSDMYLVDYLLLNTDRHMKNYGVIRDVKTLKWKRLTPIFDTGMSLQTDVPVNEIDFLDADYKFFNSRTMTTDKLCEYIQIEKYDLSKLDGLIEEFSDMLNEYSDVIELSQTRFDQTLKGFEQRISFLKHYKNKMLKDDTEM